MNQDKSLVEAAAEAAVNSLFLVYFHSGGADGDIRAKCRELSDLLIERYKREPEQSASPNVSEKESAQ